MQIILNTLYNLIAGAKVFFIPPMSYYALLAIAGLLIAYKAKKA